MKHWHVLLDVFLVKLITKSRGIDTHASDISLVVPGSAVVPLVVCDVGHPVSSGPATRHSAPEAPSTRPSLGLALAFNASQQRREAMTAPSEQSLPCRESLVHVFGNVLMNTYQICPLLYATSVVSQLSQQSALGRTSAITVTPNRCL